MHPDHTQAIDKVTASRPSKKGPAETDIMLARIMALTIAFMSVFQIQAITAHYYVPWLIYLFLMLVSSGIFLFCWLYEKKTPLVPSLPLYFYMAWIVCVVLMNFNYFSSKIYIYGYIIYLPATFFICNIQFLAKKLYLKEIFQTWKQTLIPCTLLTLFICPSLSILGFFWCFVQIYLLFLLCFDSKTKKIVLVLAFVIIIGSTTLFAGDSVRASILKFGVALILGWSVHFRRLLRPWALKWVHLLCFLLPVILLYSAAYGTYSVFAAQAEGKEDNAQFDDTRTELYVEAITSSITNDYYLFGRSPARGYESEFEERHSGGSERIAEVSIVNIFTWYGIVGVILYSVLFWKVTYIGLYKSRNYFVKILSIYLSFRYLVAWLEDCNRLDNLNITLWMMMSMCFLPTFRKLTNKEFKKAIKFMQF